MQQAIDLAKNAEGYTSPNPLVGCVVVNEGTVVGSGWHRFAGAAHAETVALEAAGAKSKDATLYVNLEPCSHYGRTPPCVEAIIEAGVKHVVYAISDPNPVATGGAAQLETAGIKTTRGVLQQQAQQLNRFYYHHHVHAEPFVVAKFAASLDGRIATRSGHSQWITSAASRQRAHGLRQSVDAIAIGVQSVIDDNPQLTVRLDQEHNDKPKHPLRIVLDSKGRIPPTSRLLSKELAAGTIVVTTDAITPKRATQIQHLGAEVLMLNQDDQQRVDINHLLSELGSRGIQSLMVEGGAEVLGAFFDTQNVNEVWAFIAPMVIGGETAPGAIGGEGISHLGSAAKLKAVDLEQLGEDWLIRGQIDFAEEQE